jgi:hypothetical protein
VARRESRVALENGERASVSKTQRRRIFQADEMVPTLAATRDPWRTLFAFAATTGGRISERLGLMSGSRHHPRGIQRLVFVAGCPG